MLVGVDGRDYFDLTKREDLDALADAIDALGQDEEQDEEDDE